MEEKDRHKIFVVGTAYVCDIAFRTMTAKGHSAKSFSDYNAVLEFLSNEDNPKPDAIVTIAKDVDGFRDELKRYELSDRVIVLVEGPVLLLQEGKLEPDSLDSMISDAAAGKYDKTSNS